MYIIYIYIIYNFLFFIFKKKTPNNKIIPSPPQIIIKQLVLCIASTRRKKIKRNVKATLRWRCFQMLEAGDQR